MDIRPGKKDRLDLAASLVWGLLFFSAAVPLLIGLDSSLRTPVGAERAALLFRTLDLSIPALIPSGREARNPGLAGRVDSRFTPFFPLPDPETAGMIIRGKITAGGAFRDDGTVAGTP